MRSSLLLVIACLCGFISIFENRDALAIVNGSYVTKGDPLSKVVVLVKFKRAGISDLCSGTLINLVLTAAHCLIDGSDYRVQFPFSKQMSFWNFDKSIDVLSTEAPQQFGKLRSDDLKASYYNYSYDVAVLHLATPAPDDYQITHLNFNPNVSVGDQIIITGFGGDELRITDLGNGKDRWEGLHSGRLRPLMMSLNTSHRPSPTIFKKCPRKPEASALVSI